MTKSIVAITAITMAAQIAAAKDKQVITIQVLRSRTTYDTRNYVIPGTPATSDTQCQSSGRYDPNTGSANGTTNCQTTTSPATEPETATTRRFVLQTNIVMPDGTHRLLMCHQGEYHCRLLIPGTFEAELKGNGKYLSVFVLNEKGKRTKNRYRIF